MSVNPQAVVTWLKATTEIDTYLTVNPSSTFFKSEFDRHTPFAWHDVEVMPKRNGDYGQELVFEIPKIGDLLGQMYVYFNIERLYYGVIKGTDGAVRAIPGDQVPVTPIAGFLDTLGAVATEISHQDFSPAFIDYLGYVLLEQADLYIGEERVESLRGDFLYVWDSLSRPKDRSFLAGLPSGHGGALNPGTVHDQHVYVPMQFTFTRDYSHSLPLAALHYHDIKIRLKLSKKPLRADIKCFPNPAHSNEGDPAVTPENYATEWVAQGNTPEVLPSDMVVAHVAHQKASRFTTDASNPAEVVPIVVGVSEQPASGGSTDLALAFSGPGHSQQNDFAVAANNTLYLKRNKTYRFDVTAPRTLPRTALMNQVPKDGSAPTTLGARFLWEGSLDEQVVFTPGSDRKAGAPPSAQALGAATGDYGFNGRSSAASLQVSGALQVPYAQVLSAPVDVSKEGLVSDNVRELSSGPMYVSLRIQNGQLRYYVRPAMNDYYYYSFSAGDAGNPPANHGTAVGDALDPTAYIADDLFDDPLGVVARDGEISTVAGPNKRDLHNFMGTYSQTQGYQQLDSPAAAAVAGANGRALGTDTWVSIGVRYDTDLTKRTDATVAAASVDSWTVTFDNGGFGIDTFTFGFRESGGAVNLFLDRTAPGPTTTNHLSTDAIATLGYSGAQKFDVTAWFDASSGTDVHVYLYVNTGAGSESFDLNFAGITTSATSTVTWGVAMDTAQDTNTDPLGAVLPVSAVGHMVVAAGDGTAAAALTSATAGDTFHSQFQSYTDHSAVEVNSLFTAVNGNLPATAQNALGTGAYQAQVFATYVASRNAFNTAARVGNGLGTAAYPLDGISLGYSAGSWEFNNTALAAADARPFVYKPKFRDEASARAWVSANHGSTASYNQATTMGFEGTTAIPTTSNGLFADVLYNPGDSPLILEPPDLNVRSKASAGSASATGSLLVSRWRDDTEDDNKPDTGVRLDYFGGGSTGLLVQFNTPVWEGDSWSFVVGNTAEDQTFEYLPPFTAIGQTSLTEELSGFVISDRQTSGAADNVAWGSDPQAPNRPLPVEEITSDPAANRVSPANADADPTLRSVWQANEIVDGRRRYYVYLDLKTYDDGGNTSKILGRHAAITPSTEEIVWATYVAQGDVGNTAGVDFYGADPPHLPVDNGNLLFYWGGPQLASQWGTAGKIVAVPADNLSFDWLKYNPGHHVQIASEPTGMDSNGRPTVLDAGTTGEGVFHPYFPARADEPDYLAFPRGHESLQVYVYDIPSGVGLYTDDTLNLVPRALANGAGITDVTSVEAGGKLLKTSLVEKHVFLSDWEKNAFASSDHAYVMTETDHVSVRITPEDTISKRIKLPFTGPVKELIFFFRADHRDIEGAFSEDYWNFEANRPFSGVDLAPQILENLTDLRILADNEVFKTCNLLLNGQPLWNPARDPVWFSYFQPSQYHTRVPVENNFQQFYVMSFSLDPESNKPTGSINMSAYDSIELELTFNDINKSAPTVLRSGNLHVFARVQNVLTIENGMGKKVFVH